jgi:hypothetical protein
MELHDIRWLAKLWRTWKAHESLALWSWAFSSIDEVLLVYASF